jgi:hypothetical protein
MDGQVQDVGQGVDHRHADAVQTAGDLVGTVVELTAGVQHGHDDLGRRPPFFGVDVHRNAAAVVLDRDGLVGVDGDARSGRSDPASASSIELSTTSKTMWCRPVPSSVSPMYMPGRFRTASRPFKTLILLES